MGTKPTSEIYKQWEKTYGFFIKRLFEGTLPDCIITTQRLDGVYGYFWGNTWTDASGKVIRDEIALNPDHFHRRSAEMVLSTLVHEMCHLQQHHFVHKSRSGYHNKEWARMMAAVGLIASDTGEPGGKNTGQKMNHYIEEKGPFARACRSLLKKGFTIPWHALTGRDDTLRRKKSESKTKYACPSCGLNAWAKPKVALVCGACSQSLVVAEARVPTVSRRASATRKVRRTES